jgi:hypothetical protein
MPRGPRPFSSNLRRLPLQPDSITPGRELRARASLGRVNSLPRNAASDDDVPTG